MLWHRGLMEVSKCIAKCQKIAVQVSISLKAGFDIEIRGKLIREAILQKISEFYEILS